MSCSKSACKIVFLFCTLMAHALSLKASADDLDIRVLELEKTQTVSGQSPAFKISGQINEVAMAWDDGKANGVLTSTNIYSSTRTTFSGTAKASSSMKAGFFIELEYREDGTSTVTADNPDGNAVRNGLTPRTRLAYGFIEVEGLGRVNVGQLSPASNSLSYYKLWNIIVHTSPDVLYNTSFEVNNRKGRTGLAWRDLASGLDTPRDDYVGYTSPELFGFRFAGDYTPDGHDAVVTYDGKFESFDVALAAGYNRTLQGTRASDYRVSGLIQHKKSGIYAHVAHAIRDFEDANRQTASLTYGHLGVIEAIIPYGPTTLFVEAGFYKNARTGNALSATSTLGEGILTSSKTQRYGAGVMQTFDGAAIELYVIGQWYEARVDLESKVTERHETLEPWQAIIAGSRIKF